MNPGPPGQLAGVTELSLRGQQGPDTAYVFDPHRLALPCWFSALQGQPRRALLVTFDRHLDLVPPTAELPDSPDLRAIDTFARWDLDRRNVDHVLAAMELGLVGDALVIARSRPRGAVEANVWKDRRGAEHRWVVAPTLEALLQRDVPQLAHATEVLLDFDVDCFTTPCDVEPTTVLPWPTDLIRDFLRPAGSEAFWELVLEKTRGITIAREPAHCGGLVATADLFHRFAEVFFKDLLGADLP